MQPAFLLPAISRSPLHNFKSLECGSYSPFSPIPCRRAYAKDNPSFDVDLPCLSDDMKSEKCHYLNWKNVTIEASNLAKFARDEEKASAIAEIKKAQQRLDAKERSSKSKIEKLKQKRAKADEVNDFNLSIKLSNEIINLIEEECGLRDEVIALYDRANRHTRS